MKKVLLPALALLLAAVCFAEAHSYGKWEISTPATDSARGIRRARCELCGEYAYESFYPDGTLWRGMQNKEEEIRALQTALNGSGVSCAVDGYYSVATESAVKLYQRNHGFEMSGVAYPQTLKSLGLMAETPESGEFCRYEGGETILCPLHAGIDEDCALIASLPEQGIAVNAAEYAFRAWRSALAAQYESRGKDEETLFEAYLQSQRAALETTDADGDAITRAMTEMIRRQTISLCAAE